jgi:hypothetical protein
MYTLTTCRYTCFALGLLLLTPASAHDGVPADAVRALKEMWKSVEYYREVGTLGHLSDTGNMSPESRRLYKIEYRPSRELTIIITDSNGPHEIIVDRIKPGQFRSRDSQRGTVLEADRFGLLTIGAFVNGTIDAWFFAQELCFEEGVELNRRNLTIDSLPDNWLSVCAPSRWTAVFGDTAPIINSVVFSKSDGKRLHRRIRFAHVVQWKSKGKSESSWTRPSSEMERMGVN